MSRKPRDGNPTNADHGFQPLRPTQFEASQMAFVNEVVSDEDIARYNLPFEPGDGRYWTRDRELDSYLWGGVVENYARDYIPEGRFWFLIHDVLLDVSLNIESIRSGTLAEPARIVWREVSHIHPINLGGLDRDEVFSALRSALSVYGIDGEGRCQSPKPIVTFRF
jgi:hypothetical protein